MKTKRITVILLSTIMILSLLAACANESEGAQQGAEYAAGQEDEGNLRGQAQEAETQPYEEIDDLEEGENAQDYWGEQENSRNPIAIAPHVDFEAVFETFPPDTVMFTVGDMDVTWEVLYFRIHLSIVSLINNLGGIPDLSEPTHVGLSYAEMIMNSAVQLTQQFRVGEYVSRELGVHISEEELEFLELTIQDAINELGGEDILLERLWELYGITSIELYRELMILEYLPMEIFRFQFGEGGSSLSDEEVAVHIENDGFIMAKHILRLSSPEHPESAREEIEEIYRQLREYRGEDFEAFFDELMFEHTEDPGIISFPGGYLFQAGDMVQPFYEASVALEIGTMSEIVETTHGYHIILRIPINYDLVQSEGTVSIRTRAAFELFEIMMTQYMEALPPVFTEEFEKLDLAELFEACVIF